MQLSKLKYSKNHSFCFVINYCNERSFEILRYVQFIEYNESTLKLSLIFDEKIT